MTDDGGWRVEFARAAQRDVRRLDPQIRLRVLAAIRGLLEDPPQGDVKRLSGGEGEWRLRVGDWRVRFTRDFPTHRVVILRVLPRGRAYRC